MQKMARTSLSIALMASAAILGAQELSEGARQYRDQRYAEAEQSLRAEVNANGENAEAHALLGRTLAALQNAEEGEQEIRRAQELGLAEDKVLVAMGAAAIERRDTDKAMELLNQAVEKNPESAEAYHYRGMVKTQQKDFQGGIDDLEKALSLDSSRAYTHYYLGLAYNGVKRPDQMAQHLEMFLKMAPDSPDADKVRSVLKAFR